MNRKYLKGTMKFIYRNLFYALVYMPVIDHQLPTKKEFDWRRFRTEACRMIKNL